MELYAHVFETPTILVGGFTVNALVLFCLLAFIALAYVATRAPGLKWRIMSVGLAVCGAFLLLVALNEQLSHAKKLSFAWLEEQGEFGVPIHATVIKPPVKIILWIDVGGEPRSFWVVWSESLEKKLQAALEKWRNGRGGRLMFRFQPSLRESDPEFYLMPWPKPPEKNEEDRTKRFKFKRQDA